MTIKTAMQAIETTSKKVTPAAIILGGVHSARKAFSEPRPRAKTIFELGR